MGVWCVLMGVGSLVESCREWGRGAGWMGGGVWCVGLDDITGLWARAGDGAAVCGVVGASVVWGVARCRAAGPADELHGWSETCRWLLPGHVQVHCGIVTRACLGSMPTWEWCRRDDDKQCAGFGRAGWSMRCGLHGAARSWYIGMGLVAVAGAGAGRGVRRRQLRPG